MGEYKKSAFTADQINKAINFLSTKFADPFSTSSTYNVDDYVVYNGNLYQCKTAISVAGAWDATKWEVVKIFDNDGYVTFINDR